MRLPSSVVKAILPSEVKTCDDGSRGRKSGAPSLTTSSSRSSVLATSRMRLLRGLPSAPSSPAASPTPLIAAPIWDRLAPQRWRP